MPQQGQDQGTAAPRKGEEERVPTGEPGGEGAVEGDRPSLLPQITPETPPRRAASLRLTEQGRTLLESGSYEMALERFEKTIAIDSTNPYGYYYLARVHHHLSNYQESFNFLDVAESLLSREPFWLARIFALRGENYQSLGFFDRADASYARALKLDLNNLVALEGMTRIKTATDAPVPTSR